MKIFSTRTLSQTALSCVLIIVTSVFASAANFTLFGDASIVSPGKDSAAAAKIRSSATVAPSYGGVNLDVPSGLTVADLDTLSTDYKFTEGSCAGGSPRFAVDVETPSGTKALFVYLGSAPSYAGCPSGTWASTGNLADANNLVDSSQLGGIFYDSYSNVQTSYGTYEVTGIQLVVDSYWSAGTQTVLVDNVKINGITTTFESANTCKNGGWMSYTSAPGPFTNQGQCVSYYAKGGI